MKRKLTGIGLGVVAGIFDVIPMLLQKLSWDANFGAFSMWIIAGLLIASTDFKMNPILKGIAVSFLVLTPSAILIGWREPFSLLPVAAMTLLLGAGLGFGINKLAIN